MGAIVMIIYLGAVVAAVVGCWKMFEKAGEPGYAAIIPIYNSWVLNKMAGKDGGFFILALIPCVNLYWWWVVSQEVSKRFGKTEGFGIGMFFLSPIFMAILGFGDDVWNPGTPALMGAPMGGVPGGSMTPPMGAPAAMPLAAPAQPVAEPTAAGWYPDPWGQAAQRYHDGSAWTGHTN